MSEREQITKLVSEGEHIASIRETPRRKRDWAAWRETCIEDMDNHPNVSKLGLGLRLTSLSDDVDKLRAHLEKLTPESDQRVVMPAGGEEGTNEDAEEDTTFKVFISHKTERDGDLAKHLRDKILSLSNKLFKVYISEGIPGASDWQQWVEDSVRNCNMLLFLHTTEHDDNRWLLYEAGLFRGSRDEDIHLVCLKNPNLDYPPPQLARLQAYEASPDGIKEFFMDLLYRGTFTDGWKVNPHLRDRDEQDFTDAVTSIVQFFVEQQISIDYFRNRLDIGPIGQIRPEDGELVLDEVDVDANDVTKQLLGLSDGPLQWRDISDQCMGNGGAWLDELRETLNLIRDKRAFDQVLTPFNTLNGRTCFPVISRVERLQNIPTRVTVIFVERGPSEPGSELSTGLTRAPQRYLSILTLLNMARRFRWNILNPYIAKLSGFNANELNIEEICAELWSSLKRLEADAAADGFTDPAFVADAFPSSYRSTIQGYFIEYGAAREKLSQATGSLNREGILEALRLMLPLNKRFLLGGITMYHSLIAELDPYDIKQEDVFKLESADSDTGQ